MIAEWDGSLSSMAELYHGNGQLVSKRLFGRQSDFNQYGVIRPSETQLYFHHDGLGSVAGMSDSTGSPVMRYRQDAYGNPLSGILEPYNAQLLTEKRFDTQSGLYYFGSRWYDPGSGRFMNQDSYRGSIDEPMSQHRYAYVHNNPTNMIDEWGYSAQFKPQPQNGFFDVAGETVGNIARNRVLRGTVGGLGMIGGGALMILGGTLSVFGVGVPIAGIGAGLASTSGGLLVNALNGYDANPELAITGMLSTSMNGTNPTFATGVNGVTVATTGGMPQAPASHDLVASASSDYHSRQQSPVGQLQEDMQAKAQLEQLPTPKALPQLASGAIPDAGVPYNTAYNPFFDMDKNTYDAGRQHPQVMMGIAVIAGVPVGVSGVSLIIRGIPYTIAAIKSG